MPQDEHGNALFYSTPFSATSSFFDLAEPNYSNDDEEGLSGEELEEKEKPMEAAHLHSKCEHPNIGNYHFCPNCGIARTSIATTTTTQPDPFSSMFSTIEVQSAAAYASANPIPVANPVPVATPASFSFRPAKPNRTEICKMNTAALQEHLRRLGLDTSGVCHDMKNRIREHWGHPLVKLIPKENRKQCPKKREFALKRQRNGKNQFVAQKKRKHGGL
jgi:transcription initiation factor TFIID subunit TAF12